jgi:hypothetical protein
MNVWSRDWWLHAYIILLLFTAAIKLWLFKFTATSCSYNLNLRVGWDWVIRWIRACLVDLVNCTLVKVVIEWNRIIAIACRLCCAHLFKLIFNKLWTKLNLVANQHIWIVWMSACIAPFIFMLTKVLVIFLKFNLTLRILSPHWLEINFALQFTNSIYQFLNISVDWFYKVT